MTNINNYAILLRGKLLGFRNTREDARYLKRTVKDALNLAQNNSDVKIVKLTATEVVR